MPESLFPALDLWLSMSPEDRIQTLVEDGSFAEYVRQAVALADDVRTILDAYSDDDGPGASLVALGKIGSRVYRRSRVSELRGRQNFYVLHTPEDGYERVKGAYGDEASARARYDELKRLGWPTTRKVVLFQADSEEQFREFLAKRVRVVAAAVGDGYWESDEGKAQLERDRQFEADFLPWHLIGRTPG